MIRYACSTGSLKVTASNLITITIMVCYYGLFLPNRSYWLLEYKSLHLLECMEWSKTFNEVQGHYL